MEDSIIYNNITFRKNKNGYYYGRRKGISNPIWLHREIYVTETKCDIPKGYHIHHIDGDKENNVAYNLQCMSEHEHYRLHSSEHTDSKLKNNWFIHRNEECQELVALAKSGKYIGKTRLRKLQKGKKNRVCAECNKEFILKERDRNDTKFCSNRCRDRYHIRKRSTKGDNFERLENRTCKMCGEKYNAKAGSQIFCSKECKRKHRAADNEPNRHIQCTICSTTFRRNGGKAKYCSDECKREARRVAGRNRRRTHREKDSIQSIDNNT